jgi:phosphopantothenoylcysteine decarboxylase/phosphopantothenate--cysteine ligase
MNSLTNRHVLLGVGGGIAAYKAADLVRRLRGAGAEVRVTLTAAAERFVTPLTFQALSGRPVRTALFDPGAEAAMDHIELARWAHVVLVAPATADLLARLAHGLADDLLTTVCLASEAPLVLAPAMNRVMWAAPATQANRRLLEGRGVRLLGPGEGEQACGEVGAGRLLEPAAIVEGLAGVLAPSLLAGRSLLVTAGPTREAVDPVRYLSNRSSGKMGFAVARAAAAAGARVTLVSGPVALTTPPGVGRVDVVSAEDMLEAVMARVADCDVFVACAAVADFRPAAPAAHKLKKSSAPAHLALEPTPDILARVAALEPRPFCVGFAAETENLEGYARGKLRDKGLDMVAANRIDVPGLGFDADANALAVFWPGGGEDLGVAPKQVLAHRLVGLIAAHLGHTGATGDATHD